MLQAIREKTTGLVVKIFFGLLVVSFAAWGIGDYAFLRNTDDTAIKVGETKVTLASLDADYRAARDRLRAALGGQLDENLARTFGLLDQTVERATTQAALDEEARRLGIVASDAQVRARIAADPAFRGATGEFDRFQFQRVLYENGLSEQRYIELVRGETRRLPLIEALDAGGAVPAALVDTIYRHRNERRAGERVFVPASSFEDVGKPSDDQLKETYEANIERFTAPEFRSVSVARVAAEDLIATTEPDEKSIDDEFAARKAEFDVPERRELKQMLFASEDAAKTALAAIESGKSFDDVAKETPDQSPERTSLGEVTRGETIPEIAAAAFASDATSGKTIGPVRTPFGWHLVQIVAVKPGSEATLASVRDKLLPELKRRLAGEHAFEIANKLEDQITRGRTLDEAADTAGAKVVKIDAIDARGRDAKGEAVALFAAAPEALRAVFDTVVGRESQLIETRAGAYFLVRPDGVTPSQRKDFAAVRDEVAALWTSERRDEKAGERAKEILTALAGGEKLEALALRFALRVEPIEPVLRTGDTARNMPAQIASRLFALKPGEAAVTPGLEGQYVVRLTEIVPADPAADAAGVEQVRTQLRQDMANDLVGEYTQGLRTRLGAQVNRAVVDRLNAPN